VRRFIDEFDAEELPGDRVPAGDEGGEHDSEPEVGAVTSNEKGA
jgi:hypothetical protein